MKRSCRKPIILLYGVMLLLLLVRPAAAEGQDLVIYADNLGTGWANWSWNTTMDMAVTSPVQSGARSMAVTYNAGWAGLYLHADSAVDLSPYAQITFWVHGGATGGQRFRLVANGNGNTTATVTAQAGMWFRADIPLSSLGSPATLSDLYWQDVTGGSQPTFYLDGITLVAGTLPPPSTGPEITIDAASGRRPISEGIYGLNFAAESLAADLRLPVRRWGGNAATRYSWQADVYNTGSDWYFENIPGSNDNPAALPDGSTADRFVEQNRRTSTQTIMTVPLIGWTPSRRLDSHPYDCAFKVSKYGPQQSTDPWDADCGNGYRLDGSAVAGNAPTDTSIAVDGDFVTAWINHLTGKYGSGAGGGVAYYSLDNEPMLWHLTHRDVHPVPVTYDEIRDRTYRYASAVKSADPSAKTLGPVVWGWCSYFYSAADGCAAGSDYASHGNAPFLPWYLGQMSAYEDRYGVRILDYLDIHYYPQASGVALSAAGDSAAQALRLRSTRSLWDPSYTDESWISDTEQGGVAVRLIPRMKEWVNANYPGTKLAISEYNWGALDHINGALAQADILGIFGREGVDLATLWGPPESAQPGAFAFRMYRNYNGGGGGFGDVSVGASSADEGKLSVYAAERSADGALTVVVVNKTGSALTSAVTLSGFASTPGAAVFRYSAALPGTIERLEDLEPGNGLFTATFAPQSITLIELHPAESASKTFIASITGTGSGVLSSATPGVVCGASGCSGSLSGGASVTVTAAAAAGSSFGGWTGCTSVNGAQCTVVMDADKTITATFTLTAAGIRVTSPNGGETWKRSTKNIIGWNFTGSPGKYVKIELLKAGKAVSTIAKSAGIGSGGKGSFMWLIPAKLSLGSDYAVRVTSTSCASCADSSDGLFAVAR
jgi:hypothetical protein